MTPDADALLDLARRRRGHFRMESGYHAELWFGLDRLFDDRNRLQPYVAALAQKLAPHKIDGVCGPMSGGATLARLVAAELGVRSFAAQRIETDASGLFPVRYALPDGERDHVRGLSLAIVDDAISAGSAVRGTFADLVACGAAPRALGALIVFGERAAEFAAERGLALESVVRMPFRMWPPNACPLCAAGEALEHVSDA